MKNSTCCNKTHRTDKRHQNRIVFEFVTEDGNTPSRSTIRLGDKDPLTGEVITNMAFYLQEYYKVEEHQIYVNIKNCRAPFTKAQREEREKIKKRFIREFIRDYGYLPSRETILYHLNQKIPVNYLQYIDRIISEDDETAAEFGKEFMYTAPDPFGCNQTDDIVLLREIVSALPDRLQAVYEAMLQRAAGGAGRITFTEIAKSYGVSNNQIKKDREKIERIIRENVGPVY